MGPPFRCLPLFLMRTRSAAHAVLHIWTTLYIPYPLVQTDRATLPWVAVMPPTGSRRPRRFDANLTTCAPNLTPRRQYTYARGSKLRSRLPIHQYMTVATRTRTPALDHQFNRSLVAAEKARIGACAPPPIPLPQTITVLLSGRILTEAQVKVGDNSRPSLTAVTLNEWRCLVYAHTQARKGTDSAPTITVRTMCSPCVSNFWTHPHWGTRGGQSTLRAACFGSMQSYATSHEPIVTTASLPFCRWLPVSVFQAGISSRLREVFLLKS